MKISKAKYNWLVAQYNYRKNKEQLIEISDEEYQRLTGEIIPQGPTGNTEPQENDIYIPKSINFEGTSYDLPFDVYYNKDYEKQYVNNMGVITDIKQAHISFISFNTNENCVISLNDKNENFTSEIKKYNVSNNIITIYNQDINNYLLQFFNYSFYKQKIYNGNTYVYFDTSIRVLNNETIYHGNFECRNITSEFQYNEILKIPEKTN